MHRKCCIVWRYQLVFPFNVLVFCKLSLIYSAILKNMVEKLIFFFYCFDPTCRSEIYPGQSETGIEQLSLGFL